MSEEHKIRNLLTEHKNNYKLYNPYLQQAYFALNPPSLSKISGIIFNEILLNKRYVREDSDLYSEAEDKRIYNSTSVTPESILMQYNPSKYAVNSRDMQQDVGNLVKKLNELDDLNIFYIWKAGFPHVYMFFIERDIGIWKAFNDKGVITPKSLLKIIKWDNKIVECMTGMLKNEGQNLTKKEVENSFGAFINRLIDKMNPKVSPKLSVWKGKGELCDYINVLASELRAMDPYEGLEQDSNFINKLPLKIRNKLLPKTKEKKMDLFDVEADIVPKEANIVSLKKTRKKKLLKEEEIEGIEAEVSTYSMQESNPFENCNDLISLYRDMIRANRKNVKFSDFSSNRKDATEVIDLMIENRRNNNKDFLRGWIMYYINTYLSPHLTNDVSKTSMLALKKTFSEFNMRYVSPV